MAYIGVSPNAGTVATQIITSANGSATSFTLDQTVPDGQSIIVLVGNVVQQPTHNGITGAYSASGNTITFTGAPANGDNIIIRYLGRSVDVATNYKKVIRYRYVATNAQTTFTGADSNGLTLSYTAEDIDVFLNGVRLDQTDYTATNGTSVVLGSGATTSDELVILAYNTVQLADTVPASTGGTFTGATTHNGGIATTTLTASGNITGSSAITTTGVGTFGSLDISGNIDVDGTTNLDAVDIDGAVDMASTLAVGSDVTVRNSSSSGTSLSLGTTSNSVANGGYIGGIMFTGGSANSGTARIQALSNGQTDAGNTGSGADFSFECRDNNQSFTEKVRFTGDGKVGIGTTNPNSIAGWTPLLHLNHASSPSIILEDTTHSNSQSAIGYTGTALYIDSAGHSTSSIQFRTSTNPASMGNARVSIDINGTTQFGYNGTVPTSYCANFINNSGSATITSRNQNGGNAIFQGLNLNGSQSSYITESGVGYFANGVSSDQTLKNVIDVMNDGWSKLKDIQPKSFKWKKNKVVEINAKTGKTTETKSDEDLDGNIHYGVMAQDLKKVIPDLAYGEEGGMSVDYNGLLMVAINTIKELEARIKVLEEALEKT